MIKKLLKGIVIGIANIIPGVSGGTMAVSMGIYDKLIYALTHLFKDFKNSMKILLPILGGAGIGIVGLSFIIEIMYEKVPFQTNLLFIGLIIGGLPAICKKVKGQSIRISHVLAFLAFFAVVIGLSMLGEKDGIDANLSISVGNSLKMFGIGVIASATMVIPGVSGSMVLMLMGYYTPILETINNFIRSLIAFDMNGIGNGLGILVPFGIGVIIGIFAIAKIIEFIFERFSQVAYWAIIGLIVSSPIAILLVNKSMPTSIITGITGIIALAIGYIIAKRLGDE
ncbi:MAG TPA: DUF368 domain-containing protein [Lachnospiraceae bacterium]|nr:DUF368 domain-containing protein [Lachnospiraceae bacterium]